ncbi:GNAT family N-acetyltransferase [Nostoc sp. PCC 7120 = FACHB-418]|uniref:GNAT family N-acetyltransferase n=1 Tax=Anabaena cylindrica FACHB-318 TaxID=2692880 RepID=A0ABR7ZL15_ANACY|nr:GNAT family N-acetyltransferase [Anabaena cylindrica FACHB-318]MBD2265030.1 GNAT family N-acetyltransferase [Anabaena sp. FACHB-709]MBD2274340.1 GNAT family N-acetyltransferase [Nostoc sp. PCC 7120 = FACHB-418]MBD2285191.1 GNAT family N-acetyltransferase [Anabaena cylindrica FACHB-170]MBD2350721.1 GNAT family N-acetyltransferase [Trichormus variabilis FACHB-171]
MRRFYLNNINIQLALTSWFFDPSSHKPVTADTKPSSHQVHIRAATPADLTSIAQIIAESFHSQNGFWGWAFPLLRLGIYEDFKHRLLSPTPHHLCLVAVETTNNGVDRLVGTVEVGVRFSDYWTQTGKSFPYLSNLAVHPQYRRHGVASKLLVKCEQVSQEWGFQNLYLHVLENNYQARQLYFKLGYQVHKIDSHWNSFLFRRSQHILLHKHINIISTS